MNRRTERNELVEGIYELGAAWRVLAGMLHTTQPQQPSPAAGTPARDVNSVRVGAGYELASGTSLTAALRHGNGSTNDAFASPRRLRRQRNRRGRSSGPVTAKTTVDGRLGYLEREHDGAPAARLQWPGRRASA